MTIEVILAGIVGLVAGVLIALWLDSQTLVRRVKAANEAKNKAEAALQKFQIQHKAATQQLEAAHSEMAVEFADTTHFEETIARQLAEIEASREQFKTTIKTNETLRQELEAAQDRLEELESLHLTEEEQSSKAEAESNRLIGEVQLMEAEIVTLEARIEALSEELAQAQKGQVQLEDKVVATEAHLTAVEEDTDSAQGQLNEAELTIVEQQAKIEGLLKQLEETQELRKQLTSANEKLAKAEDHIQALQGKMDHVETKMNYTGKSKLQLIRGIGPTYARRLNEFGIHTFADLAECDAEQVAAIIKKKEWQAADIQDWLDEAKALAARLGPDA